MKLNNLFSKTISLLLTGALLMQTMPLSAEVFTRPDFNSAPMKKAGRQVSAAMDNVVGKKLSIKDRAAEIRAVVKEMTSGPLSYEAFVKQYEAEMKAYYASKLKEELSTADRNWFNKEFEKEMQDSAKKAAYAEYLSEQEKEPTQKQLEEIKKYLKYLSKELMEIYAVDRKTGQELIVEALPVFASIGGTDELVKKEASSVLRSLVNANAESCGSIGIWSGLKAKLGKDGDVKQQMNSCEKALSYAMALSVLGEDSKDRSNPDSEALGNLLKQGYRGVMSAQLTSSVGQGLIAMNGERVLTVELINIARQLPDIGLMGSDFSFLSVADWAEAITLIGGDYAKGLEYSFYKNNNEPNMNNVYLDLGLYLAEEAAKGNKSAKYVLDRVVLDSVHYDSYGNAGIRFKPFITGALAGGYQINKPGAVYDQWDSAGRIHKVDTRDAWSKALEKMQKLNVSQSGYFAVTLFYSGKNDLDPYTELYVNNQLVEAYNKSNSISAFKGMQTQADPSSNAFQRHSRRQKTIKAGEIVDVALIVFGAAALLKAVVKLGVQGMRSGVRMLKLARAGNAANGLGFSKNLARVNKMAKAQKGLSVVSAKQTKMTKALRNRGIKKEPVKKTVAPNTVQNPAAGASAESRAVSAARVEGAAASAPIAPVNELNPAVSAVREETVAGKLIGPLESKVAAAPQFKPISERGILPKPKKGTKPSGLRSDNLVYAEAHGSDPGKVILYHADDYGYAVRTTEIPRAQYDDMIAAMSEADKAGLQRTRELFAPEIKSARLELDYSHLDDLAKEVRGLRAQRAALASGEFSKEGLISARNIDKRIAALEKQAGRMIDDIAKEGGFSRESVSFIYDDAAQYIPETVKAASTQNLTMGNRNLMPSVSKNVKPGVPRADGLVYMEAHPTDPSKAVFYYADDAGREITAKEVLMSEYEKLSTSLSNSDRARMVSDARYMAADIRAARLNREFDRLESLAGQVRNLRAKKAGITSGKATKETIAEASRIDKEIATLERQAGSMIDDIAREQGVSKGAVSSIYTDAAQYIPETVKAASTQNLTMGNRNLMPSVSKNVKPGAPRADGLVYMEAHPTDPSKAVFYYADDAGREITAKEVLMSEYEKLSTSLSNSDRARIVSDARYMEADIRAARINREYNRLDNVAKRVRDLRAQRANITAGNFSQDNIVAVRRIDKELASLESQANGIIDDIVKESGYSRSSVSFVYNDAAQYIPETVKAVKPQNLVMKDRSLMPSVSKNVKPGAPRADGLVYVEAHPTNPKWVVAYYADDTGRVVKAKELWHTEYNSLTASMSDADKARLLQDSKAFSAEIKSARLNREYDRLDDIAEKVKNLRIKRARVTTPEPSIYSTGKIGKKEIAEVNRIDKEIAALEKEAKGVIRDISREQGVSRNTISQIYEDAALYIPEKPAPITRQSLTMNERSLMPSVSENIKPAAQRADGLVYMEAHPTDPNKAILYYADDMGRAVTPREVWRTEYNKVLSSMTEAEQAGLLRDSRNMASEIKSARIELEYSRMEKIGEELEQIAKRFETIKKPGYEVEWAHAEAPKLTRRRNQLTEELKKIFRDISREQGVKETSIKQTFFNSYPAAA